MTATSSDQVSALVDRFLKEPEARRDPFPVYRMLRETDPVYQASTGEWLVTGYAENVELLRDTRWSREARNSANAEFLANAEGGLCRTLMNSMVLMRDGEEHVRLRRMIMSSLSPRAIEAMRARIQQILDGLLDEIDPKHSADLVEEVAVPFPLLVICDLLGLPLSMDIPYLEWTEAFVSVVSAEIGDEADAHADQSFEQFRAFARPLLDERRTSPREDLLSRLVAEHSAGHLTEDELLGYVLFVIVAGHETTGHTLANGVFHLLEHPSQFRMLGADASLAAQAAEEVLRYGGNARNALARWALEDLTLAGRKVSKGDKAVGMLNAANRDPRQFKDPESFDITRTENRHLGFGLGEHFCSGAALARVELQVGLSTITQRFPTMRLSEQPAWSTLWSPRRLETLHVAW